MGESVHREKAEVSAVSHPGRGRGESSPPLRVLLVEDHPIVRYALKGILAHAYPRAVIAEAEDARAALERLQGDPWDLILLDINIPGRGGLDLLQDVRRIRPDTRVLVVSAYPEEDFAVQAFKLGAAGYLEKSQAPEKILEAARKILAGGKYVNTLLAERLAAALGDHHADQSPREALSPRELQVLCLISEGRTIKAIAAELSLSEKTIATYRARLADKTGLSTNVELARYAFRHGLIH
ncbi:MAG TPA: response regulator transcription factor [Kiritimatiellia bacterium]|nr:response regulator transcription factor [Verrucomicrobiota bacterium]HRZ11703.1 response regulator transcription factor [Kiritimatiellia bacterium]HSA16746.1 response regulator transcription factor [Kiritimatiellia bacterium]